MTAGISLIPVKPALIERRYSKRQTLDSIVVQHPRDRRGTPKAQRCGRGLVFVGHFAVGFAAKQAAPKVSLGTLILAAAFSDVLWIIFFATGIEQVVIQPGIMVANSLDLVYIPFSHSLLMDAVWGSVFAGIYFLLRH